MVKYIVTTIVMIAISVIGYIQANHAFPAYATIIDIIGVALQTLFGILDGKQVTSLKAQNKSMATQLRSQPCCNQTVNKLK